MSDRKMNIMVIEDDPLCLDSLGQALRLNGFHTQEYALPRAALADYDAARVDAIITDYHLPEIDGIKVLQNIKKKNPKAVIIVISGDRKGDIPARALGLGARGFFHKPLPFEEIIEKLEKEI